MNKEQIKYQAAVLRKHSVAITFVVMLLTAYFTSIVMIPSSVSADTTNWWDGSWDHRILCTVDNAYVGKVLHNFPVMVKISSNASLYTYAKADGTDIAFISFYDNTTQYHHELENVTLSGSTMSIVAWVNLTTVYTLQDTKFWLYYGNGAASDQQDKEGTWDDNYVLVAHMNSTASLYDSTNTHQVGAANSTHTSGMIGASQLFVSTSKQRINFTNATELSLQGVSGTTDFTIEVIHQPTTATSFKLVSKDITTVLYRGWYFGEDAGNTGMVFGAEDNAGFEQFATTCTPHAIMDNSVWMYNTVVIDWNGSGTKDFFSYQNGSLYYSQAFNTSFGHLNTNTHQSLWVGAHENPTGWYGGIIDEVRLSNVARNSSWVYATYNTTFIPTSFVTFSSYASYTGGAASVITLSGYDGDSRIRFTGDNGTTTWSNDSGAYGTLSITFDINATDNITEFRIWCDDLSSITADNLGVAVTVYEGEFTEFGPNTRSFASGGSNITFNSTLWTTANGCYGTDPFTGAGITNGEVIILVHFKLTIPESASSGVYTVDTCKVWWKRVY